MQLRKCIYTPSDVTVVTIKKEIKSFSYDRTGWIWLTRRNNILRKYVQHHPFDSTVS